jgi:hypothetical protein
MEGNMNTCECAEYDPCTNPTVTVGTVAQLGTGPSAAVKGSDVAGVVEITAGTSPTAFSTTTPVLAGTVKFSKRLAKRPRAVLLTPANDVAAMQPGTNNGTAFYVDHASVDEYGFSVYVVARNPSGPILTGTSRFAYDVRF